MTTKQIRSSSAYLPPQPREARGPQASDTAYDPGIRVVPDYDPELFVQPGRTYGWILTEIKRFVQVQAEALPRNRSGKVRYLGSRWIPDGRVLALTGEKGAGKTWLLHHLEENEMQVAGLAVYVDLAARTAFSEPHAFVRFVQGRIHSRGPDGRTILLLDNVPPQMDNHLRALETAVLRPHLEQHASLIVMALVDPARVCWLTPALQAADIGHLSPFNHSQTREQLSRLARTGALRHGIRPSEIHRVSRGLPLLTYLLATRSCGQSFALLLDHWLQEMPDGEHGQMRLLLQAVCTLEVLEHAKVQAALDLYHLRRPDAGDDRAHPAQVRNLVRHGLARSVPQAPGRIALLPSVRHAAAGMLQEHDPELYMALRAMAQV